jgi:serine/threonine-protein kinase
MSPEQAQAKNVDQRSDIFSFGLLLYEMLTGQQAFSGDSALSTLSAILRDDAKPIDELVEGVPPELEEIVYRAMRKDPEERWQTMQEMRAALLVLKQKADSGVLQLGAQSAALSKRKSALLLNFIAAAVVVVLAAGGGGVWWWMKHRQPPQKPPAVAQVTPPPAAVTPPAAPVETPAPPVDLGMTNQNVLDMVDAKVPVATITSQIKAAPKTNFDLSTTGVIQLTKGGVSPSIIEVMRNPKGDIAVVKAPAPRPIPATVPPPTKSTQAPAQPAPVEAAPAPTAVVTPPPAPTQPAPATPAPVVETKIHTVAIPNAMPFNISLAQDVPLKLTAGQKLNFTVTKDVKIGDVVVIAKGAPVSGEVVDPGEKKFLAKAKATFKLTSVESVAGTKLTIRSNPAHTDKGDHPIEMPGSKTKDLWAPSGTEYLSYIENDQTVTIKH